MPTKGTALVQDINISKRHFKPGAPAQAGIVDVEQPIHLSNLALVDPQDQQADTRPRSHAGQWPQGAHCDRIRRADGSGVARGTEPPSHARRGDHRLPRRRRRRSVSRACTSATCVTSCPPLVRDFNYQNPMQVPRLAKVSVNVGVGESIANSKALDATVRDVSIITGQKPDHQKGPQVDRPVQAARRSAGRRQVTLRGERMWEFLDRLMNAALPRTRDFRGVPGRSFDGRGNFTLGLREQLIFPEINYDQVDKARGLEVSIVTTAETDQEARRLLELLGMPFQRTATTVGRRRPSRPANRRRRWLTLSRSTRLLFDRVERQPARRAEPHTGGPNPLAKKSMIDKSKRPPRFKVQQHNRCQHLRPAARLHPPLHVVPHLLPQAGAGGRDSRASRKASW